MAIKVIINALSARLGGGQTYLRNLLANLPARRDIEIQVYAPASVPLPEDPRLKRRTTWWPTENPLLRTLWEMIAFPRILRREKADVLFCPGGIVISRSPEGCKTVTMFRNMLPFDATALSRLPLGLQKIRNFILKRVMLHSMSTADLTIFISEFSKSIVEAHTSIKNSVTIPHGINAIFKTSGKVVDRPAWLPESDYLLYVSRFDVYKHQLEVVKAFAALPGDLRQGYKLLLIGEADNALAKEVAAFAVEQGLSDRILIKGAVPYMDLPAAYHHATVNLFASSCENCPNILLEALGAGRPVLSSDIMPMPEFGRDKVGYFSPTDPESIRARLVETLSSASCREELAARAAQRSGDFDWGTTSQSTWFQIMMLANKASASPAMSFLFPLAQLVNSMSMTALLILLSLTKKAGLAADVGIVQAATISLLYSFSANGRSLILNQIRPVRASYITAIRLVLILPLAYLSYWLSVSTANIAGWLALALIIRRCGEWLGETWLSEMEKQNRAQQAWIYIVTQTLLLLSVIVWIHLDQPIQIGFMIWGLVPLWFTRHHVRESLSEIPSLFTKIPKDIFPHFGSTAIIGVTVYVFRLLILQAAGREVSGELYSAFAIGGILGSIYANVLGSSIALHEQRSGSRYTPRFMREVLIAMTLAGGVLVLMAQMHPVLLSWTGKQALFWKAVGFSMVGGVVMISAQRIRFKLIQHDAEHDVFGPDVLMNILVIASVPFLYYLGGAEYLSFLYLGSATLAILFYSSARMGRLFESKNNVYWQFYLRIAIGIAVLAPIFLQLHRGLLRDTPMPVDTGGAFGMLPIPFGAIACFCGILVLGQYKRAYLALNMVFSMFLFMLMSSLINFNGIAALNNAKLVLLLHFVLPTLGLVLGQMFEGGSTFRKRDELEKVCLWVSAAVIPVHLICNWVQGSFALMPSGYMFSIYRYTQYVPAMILSAFMIACFRLWGMPLYRKILFCMLPLAGIYALASLSAMLIVVFAIFIIFFVMDKRKPGESRQALWAALGCITGMGLYYSLAAGYGATVPHAHFQQDLMAMFQINWGKLSEIFRHYIADIFRDTHTVLFGYLQPSDAVIGNNTHNYYFDLVYNFGSISILPLLAGILYTGVVSFRRFRSFQRMPGMSGFLLVLGYLVLVAPSITLALRQPYSGIYIFFLWGVFLSRIQSKHESSLT